MGLAEGRKWLVQGSDEMAELEADASMRVGGGKCTIKETRFGDSGRVDGSFQSAFNSPHQTGPAVCWSGGT